MAAEDSAKVLASEMKSQMKKVTDSITQPMKSFFPSLIANIPGGGAVEKSLKALKVSNKKEADDSQKVLEKQTESIVGSESILKTMNENLMEMSFAMTGMFHAIKEPENDALSAGEVEKALGELSDNRGGTSDRVTAECDDPDVVAARMHKAENDGNGTPVKLIWDPLPLIGGID